LGGCGWTREGFTQPQGRLIRVGNLTFFPIKERKRKVILRKEGLIIKVWGKKGGKEPKGKGKKGNPKNPKKGRGLTKGGGQGLKGRKKVFGRLKLGGKGQKEGRP